MTDIKHTAAQPLDLDKLSASIMNMPSNYKGDRNFEISYKTGHRDARHAAVELVNEQAAQIAQARAARLDTTASTSSEPVQAGEAVDEYPMQEAVSDFRKATFEFARGLDPDDHARMLDAQRRIFAIYRATLAPIASTGVSAPASQVAAQQAAAKAQDARQSVNPAAQAVDVSPSDKWFDCPRCGTTHFEGWQAECMRCNRPMPHPSAATPASTPDASQHDPMDEVISMTRRQYLADRNECFRLGEQEGREASQQAAAVAALSVTVENAPIGTLAPSIGGGHWYRTERGWKWNGPDGSGGTFPRPGGDWNGKLIAPATAGKENSHGG